MICWGGGHVVITESCLQSVMASWARWGELGGEKNLRLLTEERRSSSRPEPRTGGQRWEDLGGPGKALPTLDCDDLSSNPQDLNGSNSPSYGGLGCVFCFHVLAPSICFVILCPLWFMTNPWVNTFEWWTGHRHVPSPFTTVKDLPGSDSKIFHVISDRDEPAAAVETQAKVVCKNSG